MSDIHNKGNIKNQIIRPQIQGNLIVHGDLVMYGEKKIKRLLTEIPLLQDTVIGREDDIERLRMALEQAQQVVLMNGLGGIGKTTTAAAYVQQFQGQYTHIAWLEDVNDFSTDTASNKVLTGNLDITPTEDTVSDTQRILNTLANLKGPSLLVIDNAHQSLKDFKNHLPKAPNWQVLITSREELHFAKIIQLDFLSEDKALELFYNHYHRDKDDATIKEILSVIDYHTLTIELLAKTAQKLRITPLSKLGDLLEEKGIQLDRKINLANVSHSQGEQVDKLFPYLKAIFQLDDNISDEEIHLLKQFVALPPNFIPFDLLRSLLQIEQDSEAYDAFISTLDLLKTKGWLNHDAAQDRYKMHRIVQEVMEAYLVPSLADLGGLILQVLSCLQLGLKHKNPIYGFPFIPYGERILQLYGNERNELIAFLETEVASLNGSIGNLTRAETLYRKALDWYKIAGEEHQPNVSPLQANLALILIDLGQFQEAKTLLLEVLETYQQKFGERHPETARSQSDLGLVYVKLGEFQAAEELFLKAIKCSSATLGKEHPQTITQYSNLGALFRELGNYRKAAEIMHRVRVAHETLFGKNHPTTVLSYCNLAMALKDLGDYGSAKDFLQKAIVFREKNFGTDHPDTILNYNQLGLVLQEQGAFEEAKEFFRKALISAEKNFGPKHPATANGYSNLGILLLETGEVEEAKELLQKALLIDQINFGMDHPTTARNYSNLAVALRELGDYHSSRKLLEKAISSNEIRLGKDHPETLRQYSQFAHCLKDLGELKKAKELLYKVTITKEKILGKDHPETATSYSNLANMLVGFGELQEAKGLLEKAIMSSEKSLGTDHPSTAIKYSNLAVVMKNLGEFKLAISLLFKTWEVMSSNFEKGHAYIEKAMHNIIVVREDGVMAGDEYCIQLKEKMEKGNTEKA